MGKNTIDTMSEIQNIYENVSEWLKFAEAKHAGMFAVWAAIFIALISKDGFLSRITIIKGIILAIVLIGIMINLLSFFPFLNRLGFIKKRSFRRYQKYSGNSIFYQSVFVDTYSENGLGDSVQKYSDILERKGLKLSNGELEQDYLKQIIEVSTVGTVKIYLFEMAVKYAIVVLSFCIISVIIA